MDRSVSSLVEILLDTDADWSDRHDAALNLAEFDEKPIEDALLQVAQNTEEDDTLVETCGESLGIIWSTRQAFDVVIYKSLSLPAKLEALAVIQNERPEWIHQHSLESNGSTS